MISYIALHNYIIIVEGQLYNIISRTNAVRPAACLSEERQAFQSAREEEYAWQGIGISPNASNCCVQLPFFTTEGVWDYKPPGIGNLPISPEHKECLHKLKRCKALLRVWNITF